MSSKILSSEATVALFKTLKTRFEKHPNRHLGIDWASVQAKLEANPEKMWSLEEMEISGGEPDVVGYDEAKNEYLFYDCSVESPKGRRSYCYDRQALDDDYRLSALWLITRPVGQVLINIGPAVWWNNLERIMLAVDDLGCRDLLA